jgi:hypothetical protein
MAACIFDIPLRQVVMFVGFCEVLQGLGLRAWPSGSASSMTLIVQGVHTMAFGILMNLVHWGWSWYKRRTGYTT